MQSSCSGALDLNKHFWGPNTCQYQKYLYQKEFRARIGQSHGRSSHMHRNCKSDEVKPQHGKAHKHTLTNKHMHCTSTPTL